MIEWDRIPLYLPPVLMCDYENNGSIGIPHLHLSNNTLCGPFFTAKVVGHKLLQK
jgi:hypothetical protein